MPAACDHGDPGTREGLILVFQAPPLAPAEVDDAVRRRELADFLRTRRAALTPRDVGLPEGGRRRTPGLRREEVAQLAGVGTTWYTWLEQARDVRASRSVLEAVGDALRLTPAEHRHLMLLGRGEEVEPEAGPVDEAVSGTLRRLIANLGANPAYLLGRRWDYLAWNDAMAEVFGDPAAMPAGRRNHILHVFTDPALRELLTDWEETARRVTARFRGEAARHVGDPAFGALVEQLKTESKDFKKMWERHEVEPESVGRKVVIHPTVGRLVFEHAAMRPTEAPDQRVVLYSALPEDDTAAKMMRLLAARRG
jgi:transcriptional regulator with XRE-family HTH domain